MHPTTRITNSKTTGIILNQSLTRGQKVKSRREREIWNSFLHFREEKEKPEIPFPSFEKKKRNLKIYSQLSRGEREMGILFSSFKKGKRKWKYFLHFRGEKEKFEMLFLNFEKRNREFIFSERRKRNFPRHLAFKEGIFILIRNGPFLTSNIPPKPHYIAVFYHTSDPEECIFLSKIYSISHRKRKGNSEQNLVNRE